MDEKILDRKIKESLLMKTNDWIPLKKEIWNNIQSRIENSTGSAKVRIRRKNKRKHLFSSLGLMAAVFVIIFAVSTNAGRAAVAKIKDILLPEKNIVQDIEGDKEETKMNLKEGSGYVLYVDESNYQMVKHDGKDRIIPKIKLEPTLPEVYLEIQHVKGKPPMDMVPLIEYKLKSSFENVENYGTVEQPIKAISLHAHNELASHAPVVTYYIVDDNQGGSYVIEQHLFLEAAEGHGVRFYHMLKEFKVVNPQK
jgi:hypothetical protein